MPQMMPIYWMLLMLFTLMTFSMIMISIYFTPTIRPYSKMTSSTPSMKLNFKF